MSENKTVLVTWCHSRIGYNVACALLNSGWNVVATGLGTPTMCAHLNGVVGDYIQPDPFQNPTGYLAVLKKASDEHDVQVILPVYEDVFIISKFFDQLDTKAKVLAPTFNTLLNVHDKGLVPKYAELSGVPTPETILIRCQADIDKAIVQIGFPCLIKPRFGTGARGIIVFKTEADLAKLKRFSDDELAKTPCLLQKWVEGIGAGVNMLLKDGEILAISGHQRLREVPIKGGTGTAHIALKNHAIFDAGRAFVAETPFTDGVIMIEFRYEEDSGKFYVVEVNPRYWASITNSIACGVNFPDLHIKSLVYNAPPEAMVEMSQQIESRFVIGELKVAQELIAAGRWRELPSFLKLHSSHPLKYEDFGDGGWRAFYNQMRHIIISLKRHRNFSFHTHYKDDFFLNAYTEKTKESKHSFDE